LDELFHRIAVLKGQKYKFSSQNYQNHQNSIKKQAAYPTEWQPESRQLASFPTKNVLRVLQVL
jgi:hypothetical protein